MVVSVVNNSYKFSDFGLKKEILRVIDEIGYVKPTIIQINCIPFILKGYDVLGIAKTGSGKTASFVLPILNRININVDCFQILVLTPTRELSVQITNSFKVFSKYIYGIKVVSIYGGQKYSSQLFLLKKGYHIIVATPGRLLDYIKRNVIKLSFINTLIIDEADEMLRMGFIKDVEKIIYMIKNKCQIALFSATMSSVIKKIAMKFMKNPKEINVFDKNYIPCNIKQYYCLIFNMSKINVLLRILEVELFTAVIIFVRTKSYTMELSSVIERRGYLSSSLNGDMNQYLRENIIRKFRNGDIKILVATDVASRGLDIRNVDLIINYDLPMDVESYIHRVGRTGRAGDVGKTILLLENRDKRFLYSIEKFTNSKISNFDVPSDLLLEKSRLIKLGKLIISNFNDKNVSFVKDLKKMLFNLVEFTNLSNDEIVISLLNIVYKKYFGFISNNFVKKFNNNKRFENKVIDVYKVGIGRLYSLGLDKIKLIIVNYLKINLRDLLYFKLYSNYSIFKIYSYKVNKKYINVNNFFYLNKKILFKKIFFKKVKN